MGSGTTTIATGGILETANVGNNAAAISGGTLVTGNGQDLIVIQNNTSNSLAIASVITGASGLTTAGPGVITLTGSNVYTGATTIGGGTLQIGNGTTDGSIASSSGITDNGALVYNLLGSQTFSGVIGGNGTLTKSGTGKLLLNAAEAYSGGTTLGAGTLALGAGLGILPTATTLTFGGTATLRSRRQ